MKAVDCMRIGIAGSRSLDYEIPDGIIIEKNIDIMYSGAAKGIDLRARDYALARRITLVEIIPEYDLYGRAAPLKRNDKLIEMSDIIYVFWDGKSRGSKYVIDRCHELGKLCKVYYYENGSFVRHL